MKKLIKLYILIITSILLFINPSFAASDFECSKLSEDNFKNFAMGFGLSLGILYMVGYNDGKNKNKINFDEKHVDKMKELIIEGCSNNPDSDMLTLFRTGMRDDFNNPNWEKEKKVVKTGPKLTIESFLIRIESEFKKDKVMKCYLETLGNDRIKFIEKLIEEKHPEIEKLYREEWFLMKDVDVSEYSTEELQGMEQQMWEGDSFDKRSYHWFTEDVFGKSIKELLDFKKLEKNCEKYM